MSEEVDNKKVIEKLAVIYDDMSKTLEKLSNSLDTINESTIGMYEELEKGRVEAVKLMSLYKPTDNLEDINNMKTIKRGIISIVNAAKASMLVENSYDGQRGINKISLGTLIPVVRFRIHHVPQLKNEIFTIQCFNIMQNLYDEQTRMIDVQLEKSKEALKTLKEDLGNIDILLNDYKTVNRIYNNVKVSGILGEDYKKFSIQLNDSRIVVEVEKMDETKNNFVAPLDANKNIENAKFKLATDHVSDILIDDDSVIELKELMDINIVIKDNLNELDKTMHMLEDKKVSLNEDKEDLDTVRDDFMKNGTEEESDEGVGLRMAQD